MAAYRSKCTATTILTWALDGSNRLMVRGHAPEKRAPVTTAGGWVGPGSRSGTFEKE